MKSLTHAGQVKLKGKREKLMGCRCCVCVNFKYEYLIKCKSKEIKESFEERT